MKFLYHHFHLICSDLGRTERFFIETLGAKLVERRKFGTADGVVLDLSGKQISLRASREDDNITSGSQKRYGYDHLGVEVEDVEAAYRELKGKGFHFTISPRDSPTSKFAFFEGPDNITIELLQRKV